MDIQRYATLYKFAVYKLICHDVIDFKSLVALFFLFFMFAPVLQKSTLV